MSGDDSGSGDECDHCGARREIEYDEEGRPIRRGRRGGGGRRGQRRGGKGSGYGNDGVDGEGHYGKDYGALNSDAFGAGSGMNLKNLDSIKARINTGLAGADGSGNQRIIK